MKRDIFLSGTVAVAIHAFVLIAPLSRGNITEAHSIYRPISISIIHFQETIASASQQTLIPKKKVTHKKRLMAKPLVKDRADREIRPEEVKRVELEPTRGNRLEFVEESPGGSTLKARLEEADRGSAVKTVSISGHVLGGGRKKIGTPQGNRSGEDVMIDARPKYKENPPPHYPRVARIGGYEGRTLLRVEVLENGRVGKIEIEESSGFEVLDTAALKSVKGWTFVPGTKNGRRIKQRVMVPVRFSLK
ncbi:MAG: energy transducer TonB [Desulfobacterales bacterium]|nr:energy transducer TonB [Desulfobacterales bacterium]